MALENGISGEMGGGTYTYLTLPGLHHFPFKGTRWSNLGRSNQERHSKRESPRRHRQGYAADKVQSWLIRRSGFLWL